MKVLLPRLMFCISMMAVSVVGCMIRPAIAQTSGVFEIDFTNASLVPAHWRLKLNSEGSGQFDAEGGQTSPQDKNGILAGDVHRSIQLSPEFTARVFATARERKLFQFPCESHMKVAFQGTKRLSYSGPEGNGACEFNYSKDKQIQALGDSLMAVENTLLYGARLEKLLQHDRLGLDKEMESLAMAAHDGSAIEVGAIREILTRIASDEQVLERARRKARLLLTQAR
jgi:hypothetical protein